MSTSLRLAKLATNLDANGDLTSVGGLTYPSTDGTAGQVLITDGSGNLSFADPASSYGDSDVSTYLLANGYDTATNIISSITDSAPTTLDTLNELAAALGDDPNFATTISTQIGTKISNVVEDTTPQLGGDLDMNGKSFSTNSGSSMKMGPSGSFWFEYGPLYTKGLEITSAGAIVVNESYTLPAADGTAGQVLTTNGSGTLSWADASGGASSLNELSDGYTDDYQNIGLGSTSYSFTAASGYRNIAIGENAGNSITTGDDNIALGNNALTSTSTSSSNIAIGSYALDSATSGSSNIAIGSSALTTMTSNSNNIAIGVGAMDSANSANFTVSIGYFAMEYLPSSYNTAVGTFAGRYSYSGSDSTYIGAYSGHGSTSYSGDTANTAVGAYAGYGLWSGINNTIVGYQAGYNVNSGTGSTFLGYQAGFGASTNHNTGIGWRALREADGGGNISLGYNSGYYLDGDYNIAIGHQALDEASILGNYNIGIGYAARLSSNSASNELVIGADPNVEAYGQISRVRIPGIGLDTAAGTAGQVLTSDGAGNVSFQDASGGDFASSYVVAHLFGR